VSSDFGLAPYEPSHRAEYLRLLGDAWGGRTLGGGAVGGDLFDWWYDGNPAGSLRSVATRTGEVVGAAGHSLYRMSVGGRERLGQFSVHAVTAPEARGLGIFRALERRHEEQGEARGSVCVLAFASAPTRPLFLGPLGWTQIDRRRIWARPFPRGRRGRAVERFGPRHDTVSAVVGERLGNHVVRSSAYLNWRYLDAPREYRAFESESGGYGVVGFTTKRGRRVAVLMELVAEPGDADGLVGNALAEAWGTAALLAVPSPVLPRAKLLRHGFVPTLSRLDFMGKGLAEPLDARSKAWTVSFGDTDFL
jgi:hypothetical protein